MRLQLNYHFPEICFNPFTVFSIEIREKNCCFFPRGGRRAVSLIVSAQSERGPVHLTLFLEQRPRCRGVAIRKSITTGDPFIICFFLVFSRKTNKKSQK